MTGRRYRVDSQLLTLFFFIAMPLATFGSFFVVALARGALRDTVGASLEQRALQTKVLLERYIGDQIVHVRLLTLDPEVRQAIRGKRVDPSASPLANRLRETVRVMPSIKVLQVVNHDGDLVASSARTIHLSQRDSAWFSALSSEELPSVYIGDIFRPAGSAQAYFEIAHPVYDPVDLNWVGAVRALINAGDLYGVLAPVRVGYSGHAVLLDRANGMILASDEADRVLNETFPGFSAIQAAIAARRGFWIVPQSEKRDPAGEAIATEPARLVGFSIVDQVPGANWIVAVEQDYDEAIAPITGITRYLWIHFAGALATVVLLALYLSLRQVTPVIPDTLHLHDTHVPPSMTRRVENGQRAETDTRS